MMMELKAQEVPGMYDWQGLTLGKLVAIKHALEWQKRAKKIGVVGEEVLEFLEGQEIEAPLSAMLKV
jgi:hypothetical protein